MGRRRGDALSLWLAGTVIAVTLLTIGDLLVAIHGLAGIVWMELAVVLLPAIALMAAWPAAQRRALRLSWGDPCAWLGAALAALGLTAVATALLTTQARYVPLSAAQIEAWAQLEELASARPWLAAIALVVAPAIAEEALFRGALLAHLERRLRPGAAVAVSAIAFALFHRSINRLAPQAMLGVVLGALAVRSRSLAPCVVMHLVYNFAIWRAGEGLLALPAWLNALAGSGLALAGWLLVGRRGPNS